MRLALLSREWERGDIERRGERDLVGVREVAAAGGDWVRVRPRSGDLEGIEIIDGIWR